ncbi:transposon Tf2-9 polyprotein [Trichonephila clavipes]|nr:transposon Tf2-9 polyprotein [Trichonephila clavipes]
MNWKARGIFKMNDVSAFKIPAYNFNDPALWFTMWDNTIQLGSPKAITYSRTQFNYIIVNLPPEAATIIRDVIMNPDPVEPYKTARTELIKRSGESSHQDVRKLLIGEELGDRRLSELLCVMRRRTESHSVPDELMLELFQKHLPTRVQSILAAVSPLTLEKAAGLADRVMEVTPIVQPTNVNLHVNSQKTRLAKYNDDYRLAKKFSSPFFIRDRRYCSTNILILVCVSSFLPEDGNPKMSWWSTGLFRST